MNDDLRPEPQPMDRRRFLTAALGGACALAGGGALLTRDGWGRNAFAQEPSGTAEDARFVADARHWDAQGDVVTCRLCPRQCVVPPDERGTCGVRENRGGKYKTLVYGRACTMNIDPIEKKPLFHVLPTATAFSIATAGCNIECKFCQNWQISQMRPEQVEATWAPPEMIVQSARERGCPAIAFTYSEPVIFYEYMFDVAQTAKASGLHPVMISNGYIQEKPMRELAPQLSAMKIDFKSFSEKFYKETCSGELKPVLATLELVKSLGLWLEMVVLIVPTLNDSEEECRQMCAWVASHLGPDVPLHFTRFHPMYKIDNLPPTPVATLDRNYRIAREAGLHFPYVGNVPGHKGESTYCPACGKAVIERYGFAVKNNLKPGGKCPFCEAKIPGVWG